MTKLWRTALLTALVAGIIGCGGIRYSQVSPEAKEFHPQRIAVLPAAAHAFPEARGVVDRLFVEALNERKWFTEIIGGEQIGRRLQTDGGLRQAVMDYLVKLDKVNYSDGELSGRIGTLTNAEALLLVRVDYWNYTTEKDKKVGKVSLGITMIEAKSGKTVWMAVHHRASDYLLIKPDLPDVAMGLIKEMIGYMPH